MKRRLTCILAADAVGYSSQMGHDEAGTIRVLAAHRAVIDGIIAFHEGRIVGTAGDSVLAEFGSVVEAVRCAVEIQEALKTRNDSLPESRRMHFRVGVNLGDVVVKDQDLLGDGVNVAARLETIAEPGGICISSSVYDQITGKLDLGFQDIGDQALKNISRPIHVYRLTGATPLVRPAQPAPSADPAVPARAAATRAGKPPAWALGVLGTVGVMALAAVLAWQAGWLRSGAGDVGAAKTATPAAPPPPAPPAETSAATDAAASRAQMEADAKRLRSEAEALKLQAEAELVRTRADARAAQAAKARADAEADAMRVRKDAEADAARLRTDAQARTTRAATEADQAADATTKAAAATMVPATATGAAAVTRSAAFDGAWNVTVTCQAAAGAAGYTIDLVAQVKDGYLRGIRGTEGTPDSLRIEGQIQPDGSASLDVRGLTGDPKYAVNQLARGSAYRYHVAARFDGARGTGTRTELRPCDLRFAKQ